MHTGTISALDPHQRFGLIDTDDGRILPFNQHAFQRPVPQALEIGARVEFIEEIVGAEMRAVTVRLRRQSS